MLNFIKSILFTVLFFYAFAASANSFTLKPISDPPPVPTAFGTVEGTAGLDSADLQGGNIKVNAGAFTASGTVDTNGNFSLPVSVDDPFSINVNLVFNDFLPNVRVSMENNSQLTQGELRSFDLTHPSGRLLTKVTLLNGTLQNIDISASSSTINNNGLSESFTANGSANRNNDKDPEILFAMPSAIITTLTGTIKATNSNGCTVSRDLAEQSITINDASLPANTDPDTLIWTVDLSNDPTTCPTAIISGNFSLNGLNSTDLFSKFSQHQLTFLLGSERTNIKILNSDTFSFPYFYTTTPVLEGTYQTIETSTFLAPYTSLSYPRETLTVSGNTNFDPIYSIGSSHGKVVLSGDWDYRDIRSTIVSASGSEPGSTVISMSAYDIVDRDTGNFDFILSEGNWNPNSYSFSFNIVTSSTGRSYGQSLNFNIQSDIFATRHSISEGLSVNLPPLTLQTVSSAEIELLIQQPASETVTIQRLEIKGSSPLLDASENTLGTSTINSSSYGTEQSAFKVTLHGLAGTYELTATGTGSDGRNYKVAFPVTLAATEPPTDPGGDEDSMACYVINKVKLHQHQKANKDKLYIKYAGFRLPEDATVDLSQDDVSIKVDDMVYEFPAGTFKQKGNKLNYEYKSASGEIPKIKASIDFEKSKWSLKVNHADIDEVDNSDGVDISLSMGEYLGTEKVYLESKNKHHDKLMYKRKPKASCRIGKTHKDDKDDDDDDMDNDD